MGTWRAFTRRDDGEFGFVSSGWEYVPDPGEDVEKAKQDIASACELIREMFRANADE